MRLQMIDSRFNSANLFSFRIRDFTPKLFLKSHHKLYCIKTICSQIFSKTGLINNQICLDIQVFDNNFFMLKFIK